MNIKTFQVFTLFLMVFLWTNCKKEEEVSLELRPIVGDYYVSSNGSDGNPGTKEAPLGTIKKAIDLANPGSVIVVTPGEYEEYVTIRKSGVLNNGITIYSEALHGAKTLGFRIDANYITIDGFEVEAFGGEAVGIQSNGYSNINVYNCLVRECAGGGIRLSQGSDNDQIMNNTLVHNGLYGIYLNGNNGRVENNDISKIVEFHPKGYPEGMSVAGSDADGMKVFGSNHVIKKNRVYDIAEVADLGNVDPHSDCFQSWSSSSNTPVIKNSTIEQNYFMVNFYRGKGMNIESEYETCSNLIIRNNIFEFRDCGVNISLGTFQDIFIYNNVFKGILNDPTVGVAINLNGITNYQVINNITLDCYPNHRNIRGGTGVVDYNIAWNSDGSRLFLEPELGPHEKQVNPMFVSYSVAHGGNNYYLQVTSPAINTGYTLSNTQVPDDFNGRLRTIGNLDIGAYEYAGK